MEEQQTGALVRRCVAGDAGAWEDFVRLYNRRIYNLCYRFTNSADDAQDLTQEFFARAFERDYLARYDPAIARFRTFVRTCLDGFLANHQTSAARLKRGGSYVITSVDFARFDGDLAAHARSDDPDPERWFHREWVRGLFGRALETLRVHCEAKGHPDAFAWFSRYDVDADGASPRPTYAVLARESGRPVTDVTNELAWARRAFREIVLDLLRGICATDEEFRAEARDLLGVDPP